MEKVRTIAIIKDVGYGCTDIGVCLHFTVEIPEGMASLQMLFGIKAENFISKYNVFDIHELNGKPVWVQDNHVTMTDLEPCII